MKTIFICLLLLISQPQFLSAQRYLPAKITLTDGQILEGSVLYKDWDDTPQRLDFKNQQGQTRRLGVADIAAFEVARSDKGTEVFRRKIAYIDVSPHKLDKLDEHSVPQFVLDTVLVQVLVSSEISLYRYQGAASKLHYLIEKDSVAELVFKQFYVPTDRGREVAMNNSFRKQLSKLTPAECAGRVPDFKRLRFAEKELIKAVSKINDCRSAKTAYAYRVEKRPIFCWEAPAPPTSSRLSPRLCRRC